MIAPSGKGVFVIIPTFNEAANIAQLTAEVFSRYKNIGVLVVDDASPDGTANIVKNLQGRYRSLELLERSAKLGLGSTYREAFALALARPEVEVVITMDADFSHDPAAVGSMLAVLGAVGETARSDVSIHRSAGPARAESRAFGPARAEPLSGGPTDVVIGSRYVPGGAVKNWPVHRKLLSLFGNRYAQVILQLRIADLTAGFHAIRVGALAKLPLAEMRTEGYGFLIELKWRLAKSGARIAEVPITFAERRAGASKLSRKTIWEAVLLPWRLRFFGTFGTFDRSDDAEIKMAKPKFQKKFKVQNPRRF